MSLEEISKRLKRLPKLCTMVGWRLSLSLSERNNESMISSTALRLVEGSGLQARVVALLEGIDMFQRLLNAVDNMR